MPDDLSARRSQAKAQIAAKRPRDANGHFIKSDLLKVSENKTSNDDTLVDVKVTNPLKKITAILKQIKSKQSTVVDLKFTVPLVALPLFMLLAFSLGRSGGITCGENVQTKIGLLYTLRTPAGEQAGLFDKTKEVISRNFPFISPALATNSQNASNRLILIQRDNTAVTIENPNHVDLSAYHSRQIFVTGKVNTCQQTIEVDNDSDVQLLP